MCSPKAQQKNTTAVKASIIVAKVIARASTLSLLQIMPF